ncbi:hypothetical protein B0H13DRAFT_1880690 [Mycena leptocephala]|nr:hypothetical protein B0H13DRAFT_1880690 [Mycena leptocephala]
MGSGLASLYWKMCEVFATSKLIWHPNLRRSSKQYGTTISSPGLQGRYWTGPSASTDNKHITFRQRILASGKFNTKNEYIHDCDTPLTPAEVSASNSFHRAQIWTAPAKWPGKRPRGLQHSTVMEIPELPLKSAVLHFDPRPTWDTPLRRGSMLAAGAKPTLLVWEWFNPVSRCDGSSSPATTIPTRSPMLPAKAEGG